jgi:hypothetical protein
VLGGMGRGRGERQPVVLSKVARLGSRFAEGCLDAPRMLFGNIFIETARADPRREDALHGGEAQGAVAGSMPECGVDLLGCVALPQEQDLTRLWPPRAG